MKPAIVGDRPISELVRIPFNIKATITLFRFAKDKVDWESMKIKCSIINYRQSPKVLHVLTVSLLHRHNIHQMFYFEGNQIHVHVCILATLTLLLAARRTGEKWIIP